MRIKLGDKYVDLTARIGGGGEGEVFQVSNTNTLVKIYKESLRKKRKPKIEAMLKARLYEKSKVIAFPKESAFDAKGEFIGFSMANATEHKPIHELYSPKSRKDEFPNADYRFIVRAASNLARAISEAHAAGCVIGDINHSGILVSPQATVILIDADSFQFESDQLYYCEVGVPDFTAPELQGRSLNQIRRTISHDSFALAIAIFQLLVMRHPFSGIYPDGINGIAQAIKHYCFPFSLVRKLETRATPPPFSLTLEDFPLQLARAFEDAFGRKPELRPQASIWVTLLTDFEASLRSCRSNRAHFFSPESKTCAWCEIANETGLDYFPELLITGRPTNEKTSSKLDLSIVLKNVQNLNWPTPRSLVPNLQNFTPSKSGLVNATKSRTSNRRMLAGLATISGVGGFIAFPEPWFLWVLLGGTGLFNLGGEIDTSAIRNQYHQADRDVIDCWIKISRSLGLEEIAAQKSILERKIIEYQKLNSDLKRETDSIIQNKKAHQLNDFLSKFFIRRYSINGIGPAKTAELISWGIETAADIDSNRIQRIPGFGPKTAKLLIDWKSRMEKRFKFDPSTTGAEARLIDQTKLKYTNRSASLQKEIKANYQGLAQKVSAIKNLKQTFATNHKLIELLKKRAQAVEDMKAVGLGGQTSSFDPPPFESQKAATPSFFNKPGQKQQGSGTSQPSCPSCGSSMVRRLARRGRNAGSYFWGCSRYPNCRGTRN